MNSTVCQGACHRGAVRVNVARLEGPSPFDFDEVPVRDGTRHPADAGLNECALALGVLRFERREGDRDG